MNGRQVLSGWVVSVAAAILTAGWASAGEYEIVIKSAIIKPAKANGAGWDAIGAPDPFVKAGIKEGKGFSTTGKTKVVNDTLRPDWDEVVLTADIGDDIVLQVWDKDVASDDAIGEYKFTLNNALIKQGEARVEFDQVKELRFVIRKK